MWLHAYPVLDDLLWDDASMTARRLHAGERLGLRSTILSAILGLATLPEHGLREPDLKNAATRQIARTFADQKTTDAYYCSGAKGVSAASLGTGRALDEAGAARFRP